MAKLTNYEIAEQYIAEMEIALAANTVRMYRGVVNSFVASCGAEEPNRAALMAWIKALKSRGVSNNSIRTMASIVKSFVGWAVANGYYTADFTHGVKLPSPEYHVTERMTHDEAKILLNMDAPKYTHNVNRNKCMIELSLVTATRVSALCALKRDDIDLIEKTVTFRHTKRNKELVMPLTDHLCSMLREYIENIRPSDLTGDGPLFVGERKDADGHWKPLTRQAVSSITKQYTQKACGRALSPHKLRHTSASIQIDAGLSIEDICKNLGHSSVGTTQRYAQKLNDNGRRAATVAVFENL